MVNRLKQMDCYILAGGKNSRSRDLAQIGELTRLETGYRRYAAIFEKVKLVIKQDQAREHYLNYPHVCDQNDNQHFTNGVEAALDDARQDAVFIGSSDIFDFPLELPLNLLKSYQGEPFLGYVTNNPDRKERPLMFGIYNKKVLSKVTTSNPDISGQLAEILLNEGTLLPLPEGVTDIGPGL